MVTFTPLTDRIVIDPIAIEEKTKSGILLAQSDVNLAPIEGIVVSVGPGRIDDNGNLVPMTVKLADHVMWGKFAGSHVTLGGKIYLLMRESDIIGVVSGTPDVIQPV